MFKFFRLCYNQAIGRERIILPPVDDDANSWLARPIILPMRRAMNQFSVGVQIHRLRDGKYHPFRTSVFPNPTNRQEEEATVNQLIKLVLLFRETLNKRKWPSIDLMCPYCNHYNICDAECPVILAGKIIDSLEARKP